MKEVFIDKEVTFNFGLDIEGNKNLPEAKMVLSLDSGVSIGIKAKITDKVASVTIPPLKHILKENKATLVKSYLEVIVDNKYFIPWSDQCELKESVNVNVSSDVDVQQKTESITISAELKEEPKKEKAPPVSIEEVKEAIKPLFKESVAKKVLTEKWNKYKNIRNSTEVTLNTVKANGYFEGLDTIIKNIKPLSDSITKEEAYSRMKETLKQTIALKEKAEKSNSKKDIEYYDGFYSAVIDIMGVDE